MSVLRKTRNGRQYAIISSKAAERMKYIGSEPADPEIYYRKRCERDIRIRSEYLGRGSSGVIDEYDIVLDDIVQGRAGKDDPRIQ